MPAARAAAACRENRGAALTKGSGASIMTFVAYQLVCIGFSATADKTQRKIRYKDGVTAR